MKHIELFSFFEIEMDTSKSIEEKNVFKFSRFFNASKLKHEKDLKVLNSFCSMQRY